VLINKDEILNLITKVGAYERVTGVCFGIMILLIIPIALEVIFAFRGIPMQFGFIQTGERWIMPVLWSVNLFYSVLGLILSFHFSKKGSILMEEIEKILP